MANWGLIKERILELVSIEDIISKYTGNKILRNRTDSFCCAGEQHYTMSLQKGFAYCFRCRQSFNQIQIVMKTENISFTEACRLIINDFKLPIEIDKPLSRARIDEYNKLNNLRNDRLKKQRKMNEFSNLISNYILGKIRQLENWLCSENKLPQESKQKYVWSTIKVNREIERLEWIYAVINKLNIYDKSFYEYVYPADREELLKEIYIGDIEI